MDLEIANLIKSIKMIIQMQVYNIRPPGIHIHIQAYTKSSDATGISNTQSRTVKIKKNKLIMFFYYY